MQLLRMVLREAAHLGEGLGDIFPGQLGLGAADENGAGVAGRGRTGPRRGRGAENIRAKDKLRELDSDATGDDQGNKTAQAPSGDA